MILEAWSDTISTQAPIQIGHMTDDRRVEMLAAAMRTAGWEGSPVLVVDDVGNGYKVLDGHHRIAAAQAAGLAEIPACVVDAVEYDALIVECFGGDEPDRTADIDAHIAAAGWERDISHD